MKNFNEPKIDVVIFDVQDVITASRPGAGGDGNTSGEIFD